jgi:hypothetical protein
MLDFVSTHVGFEILSYWISLMPHLLLTCGRPSQLLWRNISVVVSICF